MKTCYIMRGLPGSGKSTIARSLVWGDGVIHSTDDLRYVNGVYTWNPGLDRELHLINYNKFCDSIDLGRDPVICDNTNIRHWEFDRYINYAKSKGYAVAIVSIVSTPTEVAGRNIHGVPDEVNERLYRNWEPY